jgi:meiotic recombination protein DMC1
MGDINKLKAAGICTIAAVLHTTTKSLANIKGLSEAKVDKIREAAKSQKQVGFM